MLILEIITFSILNVCNSLAQAMKNIFFITSFHLSYFDEILHLFKDLEIFGREIVETVKKAFRKRMRVNFTSLMGINLNFILSGFNSAHYTHFFFTH